MNNWRMAFRIGSQGPEMWEECRKRGIAAIGYYTEDGGPIVGDCSKLTEDEYDEIWRRKDPKNTAGRASLRNVAYRMQIGDVIYAKQGPYIVGKGSVTSEYRYDPDILGGTEARWEHFVKVNWDTVFDPVNICLGSELTTVLRLSGDRLRKLEEAIAAASIRKSIETIVELDLDSLRAEEAFEKGGKKQRFTNYYERNPRLRAAAILHHGRRCQICDFDFGEVYGERGAGYIEVHHLRPVSSLVAETKIDPKTDMTVVCSNCHRMIHRRREKILSPEEMKKLIRRV